MSNKICAKCGVTSTPEIKTNYGKADWFIAEEGTILYRILPSEEFVFKMINDMNEYVLGEGEEFWCCDCSEKYLESDEPKSFLEIYGS